MTGYNKGMKRIKYLFASILTVAVALGTVILCACNDGSEYYLNHCHIYSLEEAYDSGLLTQDDLMHIAYYESGSVFKVNEENGADDWEKIDFTPTQARPGLSAKIEEKIKSSYYYHNLEVFKGHEDKPEYGKDKLKVNYYGCYNGCYVALVDSELWGYPAVVDRVCVGGIGWVQPYPYAINVFTFGD